MKKIFLIITMVLVGVSALRSQHANVVWNSPSSNSSESMPCGGGDVGMNVWVEGNDVLFYLSRSGTFDESNTLLKQGRFRLTLSPNPFNETNNFRQELKLKDGYVEISSKGTTIEIWSDVYHPVVHVEVTSSKPLVSEISYENWRYKDRPIRKGEGQQSSYKWAPPKGSVTKADIVTPTINSDGQDGLLFYHRNDSSTVFDVAVKQQGLEKVKSELMNPLRNLTFGGYLSSNNIKYVGTSDDIYAGTDYRAWKFKSRKSTRKLQFYIVLHTEQTEKVEQWIANLKVKNERIAPHGKISSKLLTEDRYKTRTWWNDFWQRSFIEADGGAEEITRNYSLFRYMLGCNAYGNTPTKFNGGLFTFDPCYVDSKQAFTPDYRKWGGGTMTAQNQRLVYWPMLKSGDFDMMPSQFNFYNRMLKNAELRSRIYWQHDGACFSEQIENFGLPNPAEYGFKRPDWFDKGLEYNAWLEYEWDTVLEFCQMILETKNYANKDITPYIPLIESSLTFFNEHYQMLASQRGRKAFDGNGHLILFPGSACETYKMTNNASSTIAALRTVLETYIKAYPDKDEKWRKMLETIPPIPLRYIEEEGGTNLKRTIAPAKSWERINNVETPQLYPVFPWRIYGIGKADLKLATDTYFYDPEAVKFRSTIGWKQDNIWAACLGLTQEARTLALQKMSDGPHRFPAFWGPGYDWTPDHNWGGSGMIGLQEMLLQVDGDKIMLFPAWPKDWNVHFKLHAPNNTTVEATLQSGEVKQLKVTPQDRKKDVIIMIDRHE